MKLVWKLSLPQVCIVLCLGLISYVAIQSSFTGMRERYVADIVENRFKRIATDIESGAQDALNLASIFSRIPEVAALYEGALKGNINDAKSPEAQTAREKLRVLLAPMLKSYKEYSGKGMQLHYHLPNSRSLVRLWRDKQTRVKGEWTDISDDLSSFRPTVMEVNRNGKAVKGIELGSGGFAIRGVAPVISPEGKQLGSVEMLHDFNAVLNAATVKGQNEVLLYINAELLPIATALQDEKKNPRVGDFVRAKAASDPALEAFITPELLKAGKKSSVYEHHGSLTLATMPIADYRGEQVGVLVCALHTSALAALAARADWTLVVMLAGMALGPLLALMFGLRALVTRPLTRIQGVIQDIAEDHADLSQRLDDRQKDEIGDLARSFNVLTAKLSTMISEMDGYVSMLNTVPDPVFVVDEQFHILMANKAALDFMGCDAENVKQHRCSDMIRSEKCGTDQCCMELVKRSGGGRIDSGVLKLEREGGPVFIKPSASVLIDSKGKQVGYVEVARVVTDLVNSERQVHEKLVRIREVNAATREAATQLSSSVSGLERRFSEVGEALARQNAGLEGSVVIMEEMNEGVQQVARSAAGAADQARSARGEAQEGAHVVEQSAGAIERVSEHAESMRQSMRQLGTQAKDIGGVLGVISDIADQTNLLALNAAIEAARAGEAGRGFAVVADEVRKLAEKTMQATGEVERAISSIQRGALDSTRLADETGDLVQSASSLARRSGEALSRIVELIMASAGQVESISEAAERQSETSGRIHHAIEDAAGMATEVSEHMRSAAEAVQTLSALAARLDELAQE